MSNVVFRPTVVIGLGGTGNAAVLKLKKRFLEAHGSVPPMVRFLSIDTTENAEAAAEAEAGDEVRLDHNEKYVIQVSNPASLVGGANEHIDEWWPRDIPVGAIIAGAGQVRARGRLALFARSREVINRIGRTIEDVSMLKNQKAMLEDKFQVSTRGGTEIYVVGSIAGGTGSGLFLDVAFISRAKAADASSNITGVLVLPRLYTNYPGTHLVRSNAYGALKEIEHFTNFKQSDAFEINYGTDKVKVDRAPFDLLYLIDSINEQGRGVGDAQDLMGLIADGLFVQIASQIGADSQNAVDNIKTHLNVAGLVRGKSPRYASFGVASLVMPGHEAYFYDDARRLVNDDLLGGTFSDADLEIEVVRFIEQQRLREDSADQVIEALSQREGGGQLRLPLNLAEMVFDAKALTSIKNLHAVHRNKAEKQIAQTLGVNFTKLRDDAVAAIDAFWTTSVGRTHGFTYAQRFVEKLQAKLEWYQDMMDSEAREERKRLKALTFKTVEQQIEDAAGAWLGREGKVKNACEGYRGMVDRESDLTMSVARLDKAAELYSVLRSHTQSILDACHRTRQNLDACRKNFEQRYLAVTSHRKTARLFEQEVRFDVAANRPAFAVGEFSKWYSDKYGSLSGWADMRAGDVENLIREFIEIKYKPLASLTIDQILRRSEPRVVAEDLNRLSNLAVPLWRYNEGKIPVVSSSVITELYHYGVQDGEGTVLNEAKYSATVPHGAHAATFVSTRDPHRILLFKVKVGVPLFALADAEDLERAYKDPNKVVSSHIDRRWEAFSDIIPRTETDALRWFAIAQAPEPFAFIQKQGQWYSIKSKQARKVDGGLIRLGNGRIPAYSAFERNRELVQEMQAEIDGILTREGRNKIMKILKDHSEELAKQVAGPNVDQAVKDQVEGEIAALEEFIQKIGGLS